MNIIIVSLYGLPANGSGLSFDQKVLQQMNGSLTKRKLLPDVLVDKLEVVHCIASCLAIVPVPSHSDVRRRIALRLVGAIL